MSMLAAYRPLEDLRVSITGGVHFDLVKRVLRDINRSGQAPEEIIQQVGLCCATLCIMPAWANHGNNLHSQMCQQTVQPMHIGNMTTIILYRCSSQ